MIDRERLVADALAAVSIPSFTGSEEAMAGWYAAQCDELGLAVQWQQVEEGRANVLATRAGTGGGPTLMFNGHMDTSYSGREPWLAGIPGFQPEGFEREGRIYGLGISNMKGALVAYLAAVRALGEAALKGDLMIAAVAGEIEKTQQGEAQGAEYRGYAAGSRHLVGHGGAADMCILGEPTEQKLVLAHFGTLWLRLSTSGPFIHTAFSSGRLEENSIVRMRGVLERVLAWLPEWEEEMSYGDVRGVANVGAIQGGFGWRVSRTPHRTDLFLDLRVPPDVEMAAARRKALEFARTLDGVEAEVYVTAPGAEIDESHPLVGALESAHEEVFGAAPERDVTRWFSDASVLSRYGIATVNYGTSSGLPDPEYGENLEIDGLVKIAEVYAQRRAEGVWRRVSHDPYTLPVDLPVPVDDGAADHLTGLGLPDLELESSQGPVNVRELDVLYVYPRTGLPGVPSLPGWDEIPGARGCTPQSCGFRDAHGELRALGKRVAGLSAQPLEDQLEFAERNGMPFPVIADPGLELGAALGLPTFELEGLVLYKRLALVAEDGRIAKVFYPVFPPDENAADVLDWLRRR